MPILLIHVYSFDTGCMNLQKLNKKMKYWVMKNMTEHFLQQLKRWQCCFDSQKYHWLAESHIALFIYLTEACSPEAEATVGILN